MSVSYDSSNYDRAKAEYEELAKKYEGSKGIDIADSKAKQLASNVAAQAGNSAAKSATTAARSSGLSKAQAALVGSGSSSKAASENYGSAYQNANQAALNKQQQEQANALNKLGTATAVDQAKYQGKVSQVGSALGAIGSGLSALGQVGAAYAGSAAMASDERLKEDISEPEVSFIEKYKQIYPASFNYKEEVVDEHNGENGIDAERHDGLIAQNLEEQFPDCVIDTPEGKMIDTNQLAIKNAAAISELAKMIRGNVNVGE